MDRLRPVLPLVLATVATAALAGCGSSSSGAQTGPVGTSVASASMAPSVSANSGASPSSNGEASSSATSAPSSPSGSTKSNKPKPDLSGLGGYASGVGSGPASSRCALTAGQVRAVVGEPVKATSLESSGGGLACYYRATSSTSSQSLTVTVQKVPVAGLYAQSRKVNAGGTTREMQDAGAVVQNCTVADRTFAGRPAFTTRCSTIPDRQRLGAIEWDYDGGRFFYVGVQAVGRTDRTPAQLVTVSQTLADKLAG